MFPMMIANPETVAFLSALADEEIEFQRDIQQAREFHAGQQFVALTERLREFLGGDPSDDSADFRRLRLNVCRIVVNAVVERLSVAGFDTNEKAVTTTAPDGNPQTVKPTATWAWQLWQANRMDAKQRSVHEEAVRDSESFILVDWDTPNGRARFTPHERFVDSTLGGSGEGCKAFYRNDDPDQDLLFVTKRWTEVTFIGSTRQQRQRLTVYYPDRIEKFVGFPGSWRPTWDITAERVGAIFEVRVDGGTVQVATTLEEAHSIARRLLDRGTLPWPIPWLDKAGLPLGIAVAHARSSAGMEAREAWPIQNAINKAFVDLMAESDAAAFRILIAFGWKPVDSDGNPLAIEPGRWMGTQTKDASAMAVPGADLSGFLNLIESLVFWLAAVTDTPVSRFITTKQVQSEGSQKENIEPLLTKVGQRAGEIGNAWEDALRIARRLENTFGRGGLDEGVEIFTQWSPFQARDETAELQRAQIMQALGMPIALIGQALNLTQEQIAAWEQEREDKQVRALALAQAQRPQTQRTVQRDENGRIAAITEG